MGEEKAKKGEPVAVSVSTLAQVLDPVKEHKQIDPPLSENTAFGKIELEKRNALIKAWEENEKAKVENRIHKKLAAVGSWEATKKAYLDAEIKKYEEKMERKKAEYAEVMKNKMAEIHLAAEEKKATIQAKKAEECLKIEETASKFKSMGQIPGKFLGCFRS